MVLAVCFSISACTGSRSGDRITQTDKVMYNKYNIHVHYKNNRDIKSHYANWTGPYPGHKVIAPGTPMMIRPWSRGFIFERTDNGEKIRFTFSDRHMAMDKQTYIDKIFSMDEIALDHLSSVDLKGVRDGKALKGMSKEGIMTALGYPAAHKTPSLDNSEWIYWTNRFGTFAVLFDKAGKVKGIRN